MTAVATPDAARLVFAAVAGLILLLILIIKFKVHAMISILIGAVGIGLMAGMPLSDIIGSVNEGIGNTLKGIALLVGLGSMFGAILEESGGAQTLAVTMVRKFGDEKAAWALGITGLVVAMPVFFDAGLITSSVNVELDVSTSDDSVDMDADNTSTITTAITIDGSVDNIVGMIVSNNGFPVISLITTRSAYNRPKPPRK